MIFSSLVNKFVTRETYSVLNPILALIIIFSIFPIKYLISDRFSLLTGSYSDFLTIFLYLSDILLLLALILASAHKKGVQVIQIFIGFSLVALLISLFTSVPLISFYYGTRIAAGITLAFLIGSTNFWLKYRDKMVFGVIFLGVLQSFIGLIQFSTQSSIGLNFFGESPLNVQYGVAKLVAHGTELIRSYGTFPHPNILGGTLVAISILNLYLLNKYSQNRYWFLIISYFLIISGIAVTFSRAAVIAWVVGTGLFLVQHVSREAKSKSKTFFTILISAVVCVWLFFPLYQSRGTINDLATTERKIYNRAGLNMLLDKPILGIGAGHSQILMLDYAEEKLDPWQAQPIHNYFLIWLVEWGIVGLFIVIYILNIFYKLLLQAKQQNFRRVDPWLITLISIFASLLALFFFDHYFYTVWPAQILLWIFLGICLYQIKNPQGLIEGK